MLTLGIDPGLTGALALLDADGVPELVADLPVIRDRALAWIDGAALQSTLLEAIRGRHDGRAEALLIAFYALRHLRREAA